nr:hypothetical protein GCM10020093_021440 [Planobispora longispora]
MFVMQTKQWNVEISITEDDADDLTTARAVLLAGDGTRHERGARPPQPR